MPCEHRYVHRETKKRSEPGSYQIQWIKLEFFFCEKCLDQKVVRKEKWSRDPPEWW